MRIPTDYTTHPRLLRSSLMALIVLMTPMGTMPPALAGNDLQSLSTPASISPTRIAPTQFPAPDNEGQKAQQGVGGSAETHHNRQWLSVYIDIEALIEIERAYFVLCELKRESSEINRDRCFIETHLMQGSFEGVLDIPNHITRLGSEITYIDKMPKQVTFLHENLVQSQKIVILSLNSHSPEIYTQSD